VTIHKVDKVDTLILQEQIWKQNNLQKEKSQIN